ncbi:alpha/beta hydrolase [Fructobacillus cardui]|uniref:alpha/beta hydrolase n=1 Tax=Fructobacillus cardui TaxID=2893170 RepID=UPI002596345B|nr:alpha/beta hydrolase [uncultured Fructobacillus sp.]CAK1222112.1 Lysophospholipase [Fructobacillus cardui]
MKNIMFIHGFMNNGQIWSEWKTFFEQRNFNCYNYSWPYMDGDVKELTQSPSPKLAGTNFNDVVTHYAKLIQQLDEPPVLIGHSLGGVVVQKLLSMGYGSAAVCINSGPPKGIFKFNWDFIVSNAQLMNPFKKNSLVLMDANWYHKYVTNDLTYNETQKFIDEYCLPASKQVAKTIGSIDFKAPHKPLLFIAGQDDHSQPVVINKANFDAYTNAASVKKFKVFPKRTHNILSQSAWEEVATYAINWIDNI